MKVYCILRIGKFNLCVMFISKNVYVFKLIFNSIGILQTSNKGLVKASVWEQQILSGSCPVQRDQSNVILYTRHKFAQ